MSVWYHYDVEAIAVDKRAVAKFFNLDPETDVRVENFEFSFGQKSGAGMRLGKIVEQNPDIIFLVNESIESDTSNWWVERFDKITNEHQYIPLSTTGSYTTEINKRVLEEYTERFPNLPEKHFAGEKGYEEFRWSMFFNDFGKAASMLRRASQYQEMIMPISQEDIDFDNFILGEN
jgi:hypothetical protein